MSCLYEIIRSKYNNITNDNPGANTIMCDLINNSELKNEYINDDEITDYKYTKDIIEKIIYKCGEITLTGSKLWVAYKFSKYNLDNLITNIFICNYNMINEVNKQILKGGCTGELITIT